MGKGVLSDSAIEFPLFADAGLERVQGSLALGGVRLSEIAEAAGTPVYVYNAEAIRAQYHALDHALSALPHRI
ncbi:MAG: hypothetical protein M3477_00175, partial [Gemmatimonadota bacterium]|nr:hypothetical protein [Gemmatimonadota bacterium]